MSPHRQTVWPPLSEAYTDEFGSVADDIYACAGELWARAEAFSLSTLGDAPAGLRLMLKACALVSRARANNAAEIGNIKAYLFRAFKRLVLERLEIENGHRRLEATFLRAPETESAASLDDKILIQQLVKMMDAGTREVFELLLLGHTFQEIGEMRGQGANKIRSAFSKRVRRLAKRVRDEHDAAKENVFRRGDDRTR